MSVIKDVKQPLSTSTGLSPMASKYERAYNEVVNALPKSQQHVIFNNFEMVSGHMNYPNRADRDMVHEVMKTVILKAENDY